VNTLESTTQRSVVSLKVSKYDLERPDPSAFADSV
jgi:hypothetical protein